MDLPLFTGGNLTDLGAVLLLGSARWLGFIAIFPLFTLFQVTGILSLGIAAALSLPAILHLYATLQAPLDMLTMTLLAGKELVVGLALGLLLGAPFWAALHAGAVLDQYRNATTPALFDPTASVEATPLATLLSVAVGLIYVARGGLLQIITTVWSSFALWPADQLAPPLPAPASQVAGMMLEAMLRAGLILGAAGLILLGAIDIAFGFVGRSASQLQLNELTATTKAIAVLLLLLASAWFLPVYSDSLWSGLQAPVTSIIAVPPDGR